MLLEKWNAARSAPASSPPGSGCADRGRLPVRVHRALAHRGAAEPPNNFLHAKCCQRLAKSVLNANQMLSIVVVNVGPFSAVSPIMFASKARNKKKTEKKTEKNRNKKGKGRMFASKF